MATVIDGGVYPLRSDEGSPIVHTSEYSTGNHTEIDRFYGMLSEIQSIRNESLVHVDTIPIALKKTSHQGSVFADFKEDWYYRIHVTPRNINLGNLLSEVSTTFEVWNAYLETKTLDEITETRTEGLVIVKPVVEPATYLPLQSRIYAVSILTNGPSNIEAVYGVTFGTERVDVTVKGSRVTVFPFEPQWDGLITERAEWLTNVLTSYDGSETRAALRHIPRKSYEFDIVVNSNQYRVFDALMINWQAREFAVPVWSDYHLSENTISSGSTVIFTDTTNRDYVAGEAIILSLGLRSETLQIDSFTDNSITVKLPVVGNWPEFTMVAPVRVCRLQQKLSTTFLSTEASKVRVIFKVVENSNELATDNVETYRSTPLLVEQPNYGESRGSTYETKVTQLDNSISTPTYEIETNDVNHTTNYMWVRKSKAEIKALKQWLHSRKGRLKPVWVPTWNHDMVITGEALSGANSIYIVEQGYTQHLLGKLNRRDILIRYTDGTYDVGRILGSTSSGDIETLRLDVKVSQKATKTSVTMISYVELKRLTSDAVEIAWVTPDIAKINHKLMTIYHDI